MHGCLADIYNNFSSLTQLHTFNYLDIRLLNIVKISNVQLTVKLLNKALVIVQARRNYTLHIFLSRLHHYTDWFYRFRGTGSGQMDVEDVWW